MNRPLTAPKWGTSKHSATPRRLTPERVPSKITKRANLPAKRRMPHDPNSVNAVDQAVSRALRENLERIQRTSDELHQAVGDVVAACASSRPTNALPAMLRAQSAAASISAVLDVMARFVSSSVQGSPRSPFEAEMARIASTVSAPQATPAHRQAPVRPAPPAPEPAPAHRPAPLRPAPLAPEPAPAPRSAPPRPAPLAPAPP